MTLSTEQQKELNMPIATVHPETGEVERVADEVLTHGHDIPHKKRVICIALDDSPHCRYAIDWAKKNLINKENDQVILLNVRPLQSTINVGFGDAKYLDELDANFRKISHEYLKKIGAEFVHDNISVRAFSLRGFAAKEELLRKSEELHAEVLVVGARGLSQIKKLFVGSTSDYLFRHFTGTVIIPRQQHK